jgi:amino acid adenylation domain-containing protein
MVSTRKFGVGSDLALSEPLIYPTSLGQARLWFLDQLVSHSALYNISAALRLQWSVDPQILERVLAEVVRRHDILRTTFSVRDGEPMQCVASESAPRLTFVDLSALDNALRESELAQLSSAQGQRPFDLEAGPLFRSVLIRLGPADFALVLTLHHIVFDGWSSDVLTRELSLLYEAFAAGRVSPLPELPIQYADYAVWQREWLRGDEAQRQLSNWRRQLAELPTLILPTDRERPRMRRFLGASVPLALPCELIRRLRKVAAEEDCTLFMALLAGFAALLHRYSGQNDVIIGTPVAGRNRVELEQLIGFFVNIVVLRCDCRADPTYRELLRGIRELTLGAYAHQDYPFDRLVEELHPDRDISRNPLFQVTFQLESRHVAAADPGRRAAPTTREGSEEPAGQQDAGAGVAKFDIGFNLIDEGGRVGGLVEYDIDLFERSTVERLAAHYRALLEAATQGDEPISQLSMQEEDSALVAQTSRAPRQERHYLCVHEIFRARAAERPDAIALEYGSRTTSYAELDRRSDEVARMLRRRGVRAGDRVAIFLPRGPALIAAMLGVLKAGAGYVPVDLDCPVLRLRHIVADTGARVIITAAGGARGLADGLDAGVQLDELQLDESPLPDAELLESPAEPLALSSEALAYVVYTSGSTGEPKGVCVPHRAIVRLVVEADYVQLTPEDKVVQASNTSFDAATFEVWGALLSGACLVITDPLVSLSPRDLAAALERHAITTMFVTTALFNQLAAFDPAMFRRLRHVLFGGERVDVHSVRRVLSAGPPERLVHVYGPTENTTFSTWDLVQAVPADAQTIPIGRAIRSSSAVILDAHRDPVPVGVRGELYVGGDGLALGYHGAPELTAQRFIVHGAGENAVKLYRTGDVVRQLPDGRIEFVGRADDQVKIRGFRIEPGEVESALRQFQGLEQAIVVPREDPSGGLMLVAYVVPAGEAPDIDLLRAFLKARLPAYMRPSAFVVLAALPLNANGKVDREALPAPDRSALDPHQEENPATPLEQKVARAWCEVLRRDSIGMEENFFDAGGHSLLLTHLHLKLQELCDVRFSITKLFEYPTVRLFSRGMLEHLPPGAADSAHRSASEEVQAEADILKTGGRLALQERARRQREALRRHREP